MERKITQDYVDRLEKRVANLTRLLEINNTLNSVLLRQDVGIDALLRYLMDAAVKLTDCEGASVLLWNEDHQKLYFAATSNQNEASKALIGKAVPLDSIAGTIFQEKRVVEVDNTANDPRHYNQVDESIQFKTRSLLGVPMISNNRVIGVLEVVNKHQLPWTQDDNHNLTMLAGEAAIAIEVGQLVIALQKANTELSELDKLKSDFIAIASHELRTPLGIILGYASFLQEAQDEAVSEQASKVMEGALRLRRIIESMINLRYLKQKPDELQREPIPLNVVVDDLRRDASSLMDASTYQINFHIDKPDVLVNVDRSRIAMALNNVLSNALSFSPPGGTVDVKAEIHENREVRLSVTDYGIGIEKEQLEAIFEEFYQVEDHMIRHHGGLGIGLSISRALVRVHGGRIWAESPGLGQGATFTIALPLVKQ
ncbi:MAG: ATP-binding protein [Chloroflexota bacterium]